MNVLGLKIVGHDTGAALISNERVVAIAEERLNKVKHSPYMFPALSIDYCLQSLGVKADEIDLVVIDQVFQRERYPMRDIFLKQVGNTFTKAKIEIINHHDAHAASAFFCSPFENSAVMVYDGLGEVYRGHLGVETAEAETLYAGSGNRLTQIKKTTHLWKARNFYYTCGPAKLYELVSDRYLNFGRYNEGKLMGLAPYGKPTLFQEFPLDHWYKEVHGSVVCNANLSWPTSPVALKRDSATPLQRLASLLR